MPCYRVRRRQPRQQIPHSTIRIKLILHIPNHRWCVFFSIYQFRNPTKPEKPICSTHNPKYITRMIESINWNLPKVWFLVCQSRLKSRPFPNRRIRFFSSQFRYRCLSDIRITKRIDKLPLRSIPTNQTRYPLILIVYFYLKRLLPRPPLTRHIVVML